MPWIDETWLQDALAALKATCDVDAHTRNAMIQFLLDNGFWDQEKLKDWTSAVAKFNSCLNPNKAEFFKIGELWALMRRFGRHQLGFASGWMQLRGNRRRRNVDRGFVISDHADWPALLQTIEQTGAQRVIATHGNTDALIPFLRERGVAAEAFRTDFGSEE